MSCQYSYARVCVACACMDACVSLCVCVCLCSVCMCAGASVCMCMCVFVCVVHMYVHECVYDCTMRARLSMCMCMHVYVHACVLYVCPCACARVCVCAYACACACACMSSTTRARARARLFHNQNELATVFINLFSLNFVAVALMHTINGLFPSLEHKVIKGSSPLALLAQLDALHLTMVLEEFNQVTFVETGRETLDVNAPRSAVNQRRSGSGRLTRSSLFQFELPRLLIAFGCELSAVDIRKRASTSAAAPRTMKP